MECVIWELSNIIQCLSYSVFLCDMDVSSSRFRTPKTFDKEKECVINSVLKSMVYKNKRALQIFREWQDQKALQICTIEPGGLFKGEDIGVDVQELTESIENMNSKSLNYWLSILLCRLQISWVDYIPFRRFTVLSAA